MASSAQHGRRNSTKPHKYVCYTQELPGAQYATWGVQFVHPPSSGHFAGGGAIWEGLDSKPISSAVWGPIPGIDVDQRPSSSEQQGAQRGGAPEAGRETRRDDEFANVFATCCWKYVRVYKANRGAKPTLLQVHVDPADDEQFYSVSWTFNVDGKHEWWLAVAGARGVLRVLNISRKRLEKTLIGHGESINCVTTHPGDPALVLTASKDESLRLWNLRTSSTVAIFAGLRGHRGEVLYVDFNHSGSCFASCGIDNSIRVWDLSEERNVVDAIVATHAAADDGITDLSACGPDGQPPRKIPVPTVQYPSFFTLKAHKHYVDCVMWVGDLLISKSLQNRMLLWRREADQEALAAPSSHVAILEEYMLENCSSWFIRFGVDRSRNLVACGNENGVVYVYELGRTPSKPLCVLKCEQDRKKGMIRRMSHEEYREPSFCVRQCAFSDDGSILLVVDESSCIVQYEQDLSTCI